MSVQSVTLAALLRWRKVTMDRAWDPLWTFAIAAVVVAVVAFLTVTTPPMQGVRGESRCLGRLVGNGCWQSCWSYRRSCS